VTKSDENGTPVVLDDSSERTFLFLQTLATPFFRRLAKKLEARGAKVLRINLNGGDLLMWGGGGINYRGTFADWLRFLAGIMTREAVTDIVCFGDQRAYHQAAFPIADRLGVATHIFEEGYLRPHWISLERGGTNASSCIPRERHAIERIGSVEPDLTELPSRGSFLFRMRWDFAYQTARLLLSPAYPNHVYHRLWHPLVELGGWSRRVVRLAATFGRAKRRIARIWASGKPYYLYPLQLDSDASLRIHSDFGSNAAAAETIIASFATHAPAGTTLLVKVHPLDNGLVDRERQMRAIAGRHGVADRIVVVDGGHLPSLLDRARGVVLVNSTLGMSAILHDCPVKVTGRAIYDLPDLTFQGSLDAFWTDGRKPDAELAAAFYRTVANVTQVRGAFFEDAAIDHAVGGATSRLLAADPRPILVVGVACGRGIVEGRRYEVEREVAVKVLRSVADRRGIRPAA